MTRLRSLALLLASVVGAAHAQGDRFLLATDFDANRVLAVNPFNGVRFEITGPGRGAGPTLVRPDGVAFDPGNEEIFYVTTRDFGGEPAVVGVEWGTGNRTLVSSRDRGDGFDFNRPRQIGVLSGGDFAFVADEDRHVIFEVDLRDGDRFFFTDPTGFDLFRPGTVALESDDSLLTNSQGEARFLQPALIHRVHRADPFFAPVTDLVVVPLVGPFASETGPTGLFVEDTGDFLACFVEVPAILRFLVNDLGLVFDFAVVSAGSNFDGGGEGNGPNFNRPIDVVRSETGAIFVCDENRRGIFRVTSASGDRELLSDDTAGRGPTFVTPRALALGRQVPDLTPTDVARHITDELPLSLAEQEMADINDDGTLDITDIVFLANLGL